MLPPEKEAELKAGEDKLRKMGRDAEGMWQKGQAEIAEGDKKIAAAAKRPKTRSFLPKPRPSWRPLALTRVGAAR